MSALEKVLGRNAPGIHARAADANGAAVVHDRAEHHLEVVEAAGHLLLDVRGCSGVADEEYLDLVVLLLGQSAGKACAVVGAFTAVRGVV